MIWLVGCNGMLGSEIAKQLKEQKIPFIGTGREIDVTDPVALESFETKNETSSYFPSDKLGHNERQIKWIINCSAYTNVDEAENDSEAAYKINCEGPRNLARLCRKIGARLIHVSTDYVFDGKSNTPYTEAAEKNPLNAYGKSKLDGEIEIQKEMNQYYIVRTSWLYGYEGKNFVKTMLSAMNENETVKVINDQTGTPTSAVDLAEVIIKLLIKADTAKEIIGPKSAPAYGVYNYTNNGETTWFHFAEMIYKYGKKAGKIKNTCEIIPCSTEEYGAVAKRPAYSVLNKEKITKALKIKVPNWESSLERLVRDKKFEG